MYLPLSVLKKREYPGKAFIQLKCEMANNGVKSASNITEDEFERFILSNDFMFPLYNGKYKDINDIAFRMVAPMQERLGVTEQDVNFQTEIKDIFYTSMVFDQWAKNKQVFKPDPDFADALIRTKKLQVTRAQVEHLPCNTFYIDLEDCPNFAPASGIFTRIIPLETGLFFTIFIVTSDEVFFSFYSEGRYKDDIIQIDVDLVSDDDYTLHEGYFNQEELEGQFKGMFDDGKKTTLKTDISKRSIAILPYQLLCYITSEEPDIEESAESKKTYKRPANTAKIRDRVSEIQTWEVGVRYGKFIRKQMEDMQQDAGMRTTSGERMRPRMHFRCAHWKLYWTGKGRSTPIVRWIEPVIVNKDLGKEVDAVIHKVNGG